MTADRWRVGPTQVGVEEAARVVVKFRLVLGNDLAPRYNSRQPGQRATQERQVRRDEM
jgi:hypothetical protein